MRKTIALLSAALLAAFVVAGVRLTHAFTGKNPSSPAFDPEKAAFQAPAGGSLQIRFRLSSDQLISSPLFTGAWVDDVALTQ